MTGGQFPQQYVDPYTAMLLAYGGAGNDQPTAATSPNPGLPGGGRAGAIGASSSPSSTPASFNSNLGAIGSTIGTIAGTAFGAPGAGTVLGGIGGYIDGDRYRGNLTAAGIPSTINSWHAALNSALPGIPFTDFSLGNLFGFDSARQQFENDRRTELGRVGPTPANVSPGMMPGRLGPAQERSFWTDLFGRDDSGSKGVFDAGGWADALGGKGGEAAGSTGSASDKGDAFSGNAGDTSRDGSDGGGKYAKGGKVRPPRPGVKNPPGPDDQVAGLQTGEGVINRPAMQGGWGELLSMINSDKSGALAQLLKGMLKGA